jgi:nitrite reductase/ring-hydroxylating ferredoxin subunit
MAARVKVAETTELNADGSRVITEVDGQEIAVFHHDESYYAVLNYCIHQAGPLCEGGMSGNYEIDEDEWDWSYDDEEKFIVCPWHGWMFDITTGVSPKDDRYAVPTYDVEVEGEDIYVVK